MKKYYILIVFLLIGIISKGEGLKGSGKYITTGNYTWIYQLNK